MYGKDKHIIDFTKVQNLEFFTKTINLGSFLFAENGERQSIEETRYVTSDSLRNRVVPTYFFTWILNTRKTLQNERV